MAGVRNSIVTAIRVVDGDNSLSPSDLGWEIGTRLATVNRALYADEIMRFVARINPDKTMSAGALADAIVDHFNLDEEN